MTNDRRSSLDWNRVIPRNCGSSVNHFRNLITLYSRKYYSRYSQISFALLSVAHPAAIRDCQFSQPILEYIYLNPSGDPIQEDVWAAILYKFVAIISWAARNGTRLMEQIYWIEKSVAPHTQPLGTYSTRTKLSRSGLFHSEDAAPGIQSLQMGSSPSFV